MLTFTQRRTLYGQLTNDSSGANLSFGDTLMNEAEKRIVNMRAWDFTQRIFTDTTVASQQFYNLPVNYRRLIGNPTVTSGSILYIPSETPDRVTWDRLNAVTFTSDIPQWFYIFNRQIGFYPIPSTSAQPITLPIEIQAKDLKIADYTTGSIVSIENGATTVTGTTTVWTSSMAGRFIQIVSDDSATSGDGEWYEVASVTSNTILELVIPYSGSSIAAATQSYTIGQMTILPDGYDMLTIYDAAEQYFIKTIEPGKADRYKIKYQELMDLLERDHSQKTSSLVINESSVTKNSNLFVRQQ